MIQIRLAHSLDDGLIDGRKRSLLSRFRSSSGRQLLRQFLLASLVSPQNFPRTHDDAISESREPRHFDTVTLVRASRLDAPQKNNLLPCFLHRNMDILHSRQELLEFCQFVIMRRKERPWSRAFV